jgi:hypothetical protein
LRAKDLGFQAKLTILSRVVIVIMDGVLTFVAALEPT